MKNRRRRAGGRCLLLFLLTLCLTAGGALLCGGVTGAEETEKTEEAIPEGPKACKDRIVRVEASLYDGEETVYRVKASTGFAVSADTSGVYLVADRDRLRFTAAEKKAVRAEHALEENDRLSEKIEIVFQGDLRIEASEEGESAQRSLAVLRLSKTVQFDEVLSFAPEGASVGDKIYLLSYPDETETVYSQENASVVSGTVQSTYMQDKALFFGHDVQTSDCAAGGPLLDADGRIVGMLLTSRGEGNGKAVSAEAIKEILDVYKIGWKEAGDAQEAGGIPLINLALGAVVLLLLVVVAVRQVRGRRAEGRMEEKNAACLLFSGGRRKAAVHKDVFVIGRSADADLTLKNARSVSRLHADIRREGTEYFLMDRSSVNHTYLNGKCLTPGEKYRLKDKDRIAVGEEKLVFRVK